MGSLIQNEYTDWERPPRNPLGSRDAALELLSDGHTVAPLVRVAYLHSLRGGVSYFMHFKHQSNERDFPQVLKKQIALIIIIIERITQTARFKPQDKAFVAHYNR